MNQENLLDLKTMLCMKYLTCIMPNFAEIIVNQDYSTSTLREGLKTLKKDMWEQWKKENNILDKKPDDMQEYVEVKEVINKESIFLTKDFATKCLVLKFVP